MRVERQKFLQLRRSLEGTIRKLKTESLENKEEITAYKANLKLTIRKLELIQELENE